MKLWNLVSFLRTEQSILKTIFSDAKWSSYEEVFRNFDALVQKQDRAVLDAELPDALCRQALSLSKRKYTLDRDHLSRIPDAYNTYETTKLLTALNVYDSFGGECLEEVEESGSCRVKKA